MNSFGQPQDIFDAHSYTFCGISATVSQRELLSLGPEAHALLHESRDVCRVSFAAGPLHCDGGDSVAADGHPNHEGQLASQRCLQRELV